MRLFFALNGIYMSMKLNDYTTLCRQAANWFSGQKIKYPMAAAADLMTDTLDRRLVANTL